MPGTTEPLTHRKKPVSISAFRLGVEWPDWFGNAVSSGKITTHNNNGWWPGGPDYALIKTLEGTMRAERGDWIIRGVEGEIYPCKPSVFEKTYEPIASEESHRVAGSFEDEALAWLQRQDKDWSYFTSKESLASLLATVHRAAIEKAAAITGAPVTEAEISTAWKDEDGPAIINHVNAARAAAIRRAAAEQGDGR